jgi:hypothetical protein
MEKENIYAFPIKIHESENISEYSNLGLTKKEYFTAKAMQGLLANSEWMEKHEKLYPSTKDKKIAEVAINIANVTMKALKTDVKKDYIKGIEDCLNKLYWKVPKAQSNFIISETNDIPNLNGFFKFNKEHEEVEFITKENK